MTSKQVAQYRLLKVTSDTLTKTSDALAKIKNISDEFKTEGANDNVTNYTIEPVWLSDINKKVEAGYMDGSSYKQLYIATDAIPEFITGTEHGEDYYALCTPQGTGLGLSIAKNQSFYTESGDDRKPLYAPMPKSKDLTLPGQAYTIKAIIDDIVFSSILIDKSNSYTMYPASGGQDPIYYTFDGDYIPGCVLSGGKLYKADTLEIIPVTVNGGQLVLTDTIVAMLPTTQKQASDFDFYYYDPETNTINEIPGPEANYDISYNCTLSHGNDFYVTDPTPDDNRIYTIMKVSPINT